jgi:hypothetical protein
MRFAALLKSCSNLASLPMSQPAIQWPGCGLSGASSQPASIAPLNLAQAFFAVRFWRRLDLIAWEHSPMGTAS